MTPKAAAQHQNVCEQPAVGKTTICSFISCDQRSMLLAQDNLNNQRDNFEPNNRAVFLPPGTSLVTGWDSLALGTLLLDGVGLRICSKVATPF